MGFFNTVRKGFNDASKVVKSAVRKTGRGLYRGAKSAYENRDLIAKGLSLAAPVASAAAAGFGTGGPAGAVAGAVGAGLAQKEDVGRFVNDVKNRVKGKTKGGKIDKKVKEDLKGEVLKKIPGVGGNGPLDDGTRNRLKTLAEGQSI